MNSRRKEVIALAALVSLGAAMAVFGPHNSLDIKFFYTQTQAQAFFAGLSADQAKIYLRNECLDLGFLTSYSTLAFLLLRRLLPTQPYIARLGLIPGAYDLVETLTIICILVGALNEAPWWLGAVTCAKWVAGAGVAGRIVWEWFRQRHHSPAK